MIFETIHSRRVYLFITAQLGFTKIVHRPASSIFCQKVNEAGFKQSLLATLYLRNSSETLK